MDTVKTKPPFFATKAALALVAGSGAWFLYELRGESPQLLALAAFFMFGLLAIIAACDWLVRHGRVSPQLRDRLVLLSTSIMLGLFCVELLLRLALPLLPLSVRQLADEARTDEARNAMRETLSESPFVKFRPDMTVRSMGERGEDFVYEWRTDRLGFKNPPALVDSKIFAVAMGDSFTEGMGLAIPDTWPSQLSGLGYATYNLAVQGNSLTQMLGSLTRYGLPLRPSACLIGYTGTIFSREAAYAASAKSKMTTELRSKHEIKRLNRLVLLALPRAAMRVLNYEVRAPAINAGIRYAPMRRWEREILFANFVTVDRLENDPEWQAALIRIGQISLACKERGAQTLLLYFPHRQTVYYAKATGKELPPDFFESIESALMARHAAQLGLPFLDLTDDFVAYVGSLQESPQDSDLPFLMFDGHPSPKGQSLIANAVAKKLERLGFKSAAKAP